MKLVHTASSSVYELHPHGEHPDCDVVAAIRRISDVGGTTNGEQVERLRKDGQLIPVHEMTPPQVGRPWQLLLQIRDDGVLTERTTTPVVRIEDG